MPLRNSAHCVDRQTMVLLENGVSEETIENIIPMWDVYYNFEDGNGALLTPSDVLGTEQCIRRSEPTKLQSINGNPVCPAVRFRFENPPDCLIKLIVEDSQNPDLEQHKLLLTDKHTVVVLGQCGRSDQPWFQELENLRQQLQQLAQLPEAGGSVAAEDIRAQTEDIKAQIAAMEMDGLHGELSNRLGEGELAAVENLRTYLTSVDFDTGVYVERKNGGVGRVVAIEAPEDSSMVCSLILANEEKSRDINTKVIKDAIPLDMRRELDEDIECQWLPTDFYNVLGEMPFMEYFHNWYDFLLLKNHTNFDEAWTGLAPAWPENLQLTTDMVWGLPGPDHAIFGNGNGNGTLTLQRMHHHKTLGDYSLAEIWRP